MPPPDEESRAQILQIELRKMPVSSGLDISRLTQLTSGFSGAEIVAVCSEAAMMAVEEGAEWLSQRLLEAAAAEVKPQITRSMLDFYENFADKQ